MQAASRCSDLSWGLKHDEHSDISKASGENQEIDMDLSSHTSMKTTRDTTQNALPRPLRDRSWNELEKTLIGLFSVVCAIKGGVQLERFPPVQVNWSSTWAKSALKLFHSVSSEKLNNYSAGIPVTLCIQKIQSSPFLHPRCFYLFLQSDLNDFH